MYSATRYFTNKIMVNLSGLKYYTNLLQHTTESRSHSMPKAERKTLKRQRSSKINAFSLNDAKQPNVFIASVTYIRLHTQRPLMSVLGDLTIWTHSNHPCLLRLPSELRNRIHNHVFASEPKNSQSKSVALSTSEYHVKNIELRLILEDGIRGTSEDTNTCGYYNTIIPSQRRRFRGG